MSVGLWQLAASHGLPDSPSLCSSANGRPATFSTSQDYNPLFPSEEKNTFPSTVKCHSSSSCVKCHSPLSSLLSVPAPSITIPYNLPQFTCHAIAQYHILALGKAAWTLKDKNIQWEWISDGYQHPLHPFVFVLPTPLHQPEYQSTRASTLSSLMQQQSVEKYLLVGK